MQERIMESHADDIKVEIVSRAQDVEDVKVEPDDRPHQDSPFAKICALEPILPDIPDLQSAQFSQEVQTLRDRRIQVLPIDQSESLSLSARDDIEQLRRELQELRREILSPEQQTVTDRLIRDVQVLHDKVFSSRSPQVDHIPPSSSLDQIPFKSSPRDTLTALSQMHNDELSQLDAYNNDQLEETKGEQARICIKLATQFQEERKAAEQRVSDLNEGCRKLSDELVAYRKQCFADIEAKKTSNEERRTKQAEELKAAQKALDDAKEAQGKGASGTDIIGAQNRWLECEAKLKKMPKDHEDELKKLKQEFGL